MLLTMGILVIDDSYFEPSAHIFTKKTTILPTLIIFHRIVFIKTCIKVKAAAGNRLVFRTKPNTVISKMTKVKSIGIHVGNSLELMIFFLINKTIRLFIFFFGLCFFFMNRTKQEKEPILFINLSTHLSDILIYIFFSNRLNILPTKILPQLFRRKHVVYTTISLI